MSWTHRDRLLAALHHEEPDRVPIDFGGAEFTSIIVPAYERLKHYLGMEHETRLLSRMHSVVHPDEEVLQRFGVDTRNVLPGSYEGGLARNIDENNFIDIFGVHWQRTVGAKDIHYLHVDGPFYEGKLSIDAIDAFAWPDPDNPGLVKGIKERVAEIKALGDYAVCLYLPGGVIHRGYAMRGFETYLKDLYKKGQSMEAERAILSLFDIVARRSQKGIYDKDLQFFKNFGFVNNRAIEIDIGEFRINQPPNPTYEELKILSYQIRDFLKMHAPKHLSEVENKIADQIEQYK